MGFTFAMIISLLAAASSRGILRPCLTGKREVFLRSRAAA